MHLSGSDFLYLVAGNNRSIMSSFQEKHKLPSMLNYTADMITSTDIDENLIHKVLL